MSEFLDAVCGSPRIFDLVHIDEGVFCQCRGDGYDVGFTVREDGWYGWFVAEYPRRLLDPAMTEADAVIRAIPCDAPHLFRFELNEESGILRAVFQLPIFAEARLEDDIPAAIRALVEEWSLLVPFIDRIVAGERADALLEDVEGVVQRLRRPARAFIAWVAPDAAIAAIGGFQRDFVLCLVDKSLNRFVFQAQSVLFRPIGQRQFEMNGFGVHVNFEFGDQGLEQCAQGRRWEFPDCAPDIGEFLDHFICDIIGGSAVDRRRCFGLIDPGDDRR